ncbi:putative holin-like toxin [Brochothrix thermosphacta]
MFFMTVFELLQLIFGFEMFIISLVSLIYEG